MEEKCGGFSLIVQIFPQLWCNFARRDAVFPPRGIILPRIRDETPIVETLLQSNVLRKFLNDTANYILTSISSLLLSIRELSDEGQRRRIVFWRDG